MTAEFDTRNSMSRRFLSAGFALGLALLGPQIAPSLAQGVPEQPLRSATLPDTDEQRIAELVVANHILFAQAVLDGFGHISVRSARNPKHFFMARSLAPALVTRDDILEFDEDSKPVDPRGRDLYGERFIHGEIYRVRPDVYSVIHSHTSAVLPFGLTNAPLKAAIHVAYFLGTEPAPVFDIRDAMGPKNLMLVREFKSGAALAKTLGDRSVVLMRGHGMAVAAPSIRDAVFRAIYTSENARVVTEAMRLGTPVFMNEYEVTRVEPVSRQWEQWAGQVGAGRK
jgi:ribulose-5-phosphate 4-epimerase/fuculose-1-phosphate aldolase